MVFNFSINIKKKISNQIKTKQKSKVIKKEKKEKKMNISKVSMGGTCDERCSYQYQYDVSTTCTATNYKTYISLSYDSGLTSPVVFNNVKYNVTNLELYSPSLHEFNGKYAEAELIIVHTSLDSSNMLLVCIPCVTQGNNSNELITSLLKQICDKPLTIKQPTMQLSVSSLYNLNSIIPNQPFFYYISQTNSMSVIVYDIKDGITTNSEMITKLKQLIKAPSESPIKESRNQYLFYNHKGPSMLGGYQKGKDDQIFIDCSPTGHSDETTDITVNKTTENDFYLSGDTFVLFFCFLAFIIILLFFDKFFQIIGTGNSKSISLFSNK